MRAAAFKTALLPSLEVAAVYLHGNEASFNVIKLEWQSINTQTPDHFQYNFDCLATDSS